MNQQTNIQTVNVDVNDQQLLTVFQKYGVTSSYPINYSEFVKDVVNTTTYTQTFVFDSFSTNYTFTL